MCILFNEYYFLSVFGSRTNSNCPEYSHELDATTSAGSFLANSVSIVLLPPSTTHVRIIRVSLLLSKLSKEIFVYHNILKPTNWKKNNKVQVNIWHENYRNVLWFLDTLLRDRFLFDSSFCQTFPRNTPFDKSPLNLFSILKKLQYIRLYFNLR